MKSGKLRSVLLSVSIMCFAILASAERRPIIGISDTYKDGTNAAVPRSYVNAVLLNGGIPVVIPLMNDENELIELLNMLDGVIFTGGEDYDPAYYNERPIPQMGTINAPRDKFDIKLLQLAAERGIPVLGICRGAQLINIVFGGSLYQDLPAQYVDTSIRHRQRQSSTEASHAVIVEDHTVFADIVKDRMLMVNSSHHQAVKDVARGFRVVGRSPDKVVEAIEKIDDDHWILGVQFHPEMRVTSDMAMRRIFQRFISEAGSFENKNRTVKPLIASRPQTARELSQESRVEHIPETTTAPQVIHKTVVDTQYIYKTFHDTLYVNVPPDTVYITVPDTKIVTVQPDTVYISVPDTKIVALPSETVHLSVPDPKIVSLPPDTVSFMNLDSELPQVSTFTSDTLIFTPGEITAPIAEKSGSSLFKMRGAEKAKNKKDKQEAEVKEAKDRKELIEKDKEKTNQQKTEKKEQDEKEKFEQQYAKAKEKDFKKLQKENAKIDKKELKANQKKEKEQQKKKE